LANFAIASHALRQLRKSGSSGSMWCLMLRRVAMDELTARIVELEIRYAQQNHLVEELNSELTVSNNRIDRLERELAALREVLGSMGPDLLLSPDE
jgi:uncharacterized coiled-coil protein SlyX